ncbi:bifunctional glutamate--cysteine ligase GshA/glutathione synthetase GshB [Vagococcus bubulae]|uniref:Glutathione biosynthesis bifunctional protein GshAB n=1 Tax=Vagococcus bubulae TaxID=1977868 RepID=A0A429ZN17_9ENTE|nr:bifunctional glutamate--cysteine ligase GshA/glutathione synthetase GshB [Vagococcus bubulae]RST95068.1 bifunctional glutamate--cysteine ligase/glutathione synthetase [Vagococcus bubulae]
MKSLQIHLTDERIQSVLSGFKIGLEKESQRVTSDGQLATTDHPTSLGSRSFHPYIQTDFSETQTELITQVFDTDKGAIEQLEALHDVVVRSMENGERLWPISMPPDLPEDDRDIKIAKLENQGDINYRRYLAKVYGKRKQMVSGIHYNFEFSHDLLLNLFQIQTEYSDFTLFRTDVYLKVSRQYLRYRWLITYLFGASPYADKRYFTDKEPEQPVRSIRNSEYGYTNRPEIEVSYQTIDQYVSDLEELVDNGELIETKEFYSSVRLRGSDNVEELLTHGVSYIEIRNIDLNPFERTGVSESTLRFLHLFLLTLLFLDEESTDAKQMLDLGTEYNNKVSLEHPLEKTMFQEEGEWLLEKLMQLNTQLTTPFDCSDLLNEAKTVLAYPNKTLAGQMLEVMTEKSWTNEEFGRHFANLYYDQAFEKPYQLAGYRDMELSTQIFMFDAIQKGVKVEVMDRVDQFLRLSFDGQVEYVKNANMTSRDSYVVPLMMENKTVTKKVLAKAGYHVPGGKEFSTVDEALISYPIFKDSPIVVKPKSTNYGLGISIFKEGATKEDYDEAVRIAFSEDDSILVEEFLPGTEYRFFVLDGKTRAVMLRTPANVLGDGRQTVAELVAEKNKDSLRGTHHRAPLEKIQLGDIEQLMLKEQGLTPMSIPEKDQRVSLRENSNVSTGGDSLDVTEEMNDSYKHIAESAVEALGAKICGIDLIIPDSTIHGNKQDAQTYGIIEANFNPAMHMHIYPYAGVGQRLTMDVLMLLYPQLNN